MRIESSEKGYVLLNNEGLTILEPFADESIVDFSHYVRKEIENSVVTMGCLRRLKIPGDIIKDNGICELLLILMKLEIEI